MFDVTQNRKLTSENRQTGRRSSKDSTPGEHRQDGGYENNQPTNQQQQQQQQQHPVPITINAMDLKEVTSFTFLGSIVSTTGGTDEDVKSRIGKARNTFINLKPIWKSSSLTINNKIRIFNINDVKSVLPYGSET
ncbi:unnamed protein product [Trichobilharzia szidati]|nr:unnamed protein product [Trichobilharzia szidati]